MELLNGVLWSSSLEEGNRPYLKNTSLCRGYVGVIQGLYRGYMKVLWGYIGAMRVIQGLDNIADPNQRTTRTNWVLPAPINSLE